MAEVSMRGTLPKDKELAAATTILSDAISAYLDLYGRLYRVAVGDGTGPTPTFEDIGRLTVFADVACGHLQELRSYVEGFQKNVIWLDAVRTGTPAEPGDLA